jgi:hypothetical protein
MMLSPTVVRRDRRVIAGLLGVVVLVAFGISRHQGRPLELGSPEYVNYIDDRVASCIRQRFAADRERTHGDVSMMPTPLEREVICRFIVEEFDHLHPEARPYRY